MFLARVVEATWANADVEMQKIVPRATRAHASFLICELHGLNWSSMAPKMLLGW